MKIVVLVKEVPDTYGERVLDLETGLADRAASERVVDEIVERGLEYAISYAEKNPGTEVIALSMAAEEASASVRKALAMGADRAVLIVDEALHGADITLTAQALAAALTHVGYDLIIAGDQSTDGAGGVVPAAVAELLDIPQLPRLATIEVTDSTVSGTRVSDRVTLSLTAELPAIASVSERFAEPRFPNFKGIMAAKKKPFEMLSLSDIGADIDVLGRPRSIMTEIAAKPARQAGIKVVADENTGKELAEFLKKNQLV
jgi:electron transfer flavoprotein beta subunit